MALTLGYDLRLRLSADAVVRNLRDEFLDDVDGLRNLGAAHLAARIAVALVRDDGLEMLQVAISAVAGGAHVVFHAGTLREGADHRKLERVLEANVAYAA